MRLGIVTCESIQPFFEKDRSFIDELKRAGIEPVSLVWNSPKLDFSSVDAVLLRTPWDYADHFEDFTKFLKGLQALEIPVLNSPELMYWNFDKRYLFDLEKKGVAIPETLFVEKGNPLELKDFLTEAGWKKAVAKPVISAGAIGTFVVDLEGDLSSGQQEFDQLIAERSMFVQPFIPEIKDPGEISLIYFGDSFSHAIFKTPAKEDFRVQPQFGSTLSRFEPTAELLSQASAILGLLPETPVYARVDGVERNGKFVLMELELIEPHLYLDLAEGASAKFVSKLKSRL